MKKMIFRLSLLIVGLLMGTTCSFSQIPSMKSIPDSILAHYSSLESRGYIAVKPDSVTKYGRTSFFLGNVILGDIDLAQRVNPPYFPGGTYYVLLKDTPEKKFAINMIDFMKMKDSLQIENRITSFINAIKNEKSFKKFFKAVKKIYDYDYTIDDVVKFVTADSGQVVFPECDAEMVKSFMKAYHVEPNDFLIYFKIQKTEDYYLKHLWESPFVPEFFHGIGTDEERHSINGYSTLGSDYKPVIGKYETAHTRETHDGFWNHEDVYWDELNAVIDGDRFSIRLRNSRKEIFDTLKNNKDFLRFLAHHFPSKREILLHELSVNYKQLVGISKDGKEVWTSKLNKSSYLPERRCSFYKSADGLWTLDKTSQYGKSGTRQTESGTYSKTKDFYIPPTPFYIVFDSKVTTAMLPYITVDNTPDFGKLVDDSNIKSTSITFNDEDMNLKFTPAFKAGFWVKSGTTPLYSAEGISDGVFLTNAAPKEDFLYGSVSNFEISVGLDNSDPSNVKVIRNGIDKAKAMNLRKEFEKKSDIADEEEKKRENADFIKKYAPKYGLSQVKAFMNNGGKPFIGMSLAIFNGLYVDDFKSGYYRNVRVIREDSFGNAVYVYNWRWYYFYNGKLHHWVDRY